MRRDVKFVVAGQIHREFIIDVNGRAATNLQGGSLLYAAASIRYWGDRVGLVGVVDKQYPVNDLNVLKKNDLDVRGIKITDENLELRSFHAYPNAKNTICENQVAVYTANNLVYPKELLGYKSDSAETNCMNFPHYSRLLMEKIPREYLEATAAHLCPLDAACQIRLAATLEKGAIRCLTIQPHWSTMIPERLKDVAVLAKDTAALYVHETELRNLFRTRTQNLWEMTSILSGYGCHAVVVRNQQGGYSLFDGFGASRYLIPDYQVKVIDPTGENEVFCGAFLASYNGSYNPLEAAISGSAAASIKREVSGPFSIYSTLPGLDKARMENIRNRVVKF